jgi:hypothetical protein
MKDENNGQKHEKITDTKNLLCDGNILLFDLYEKMHIAERGNSHTGRSNHNQ